MRVLRELPHSYPFRFVEEISEPSDAGFSRGSVRAGVSANGRAAMGVAWASPFLLAEAIAQSALLLEGGDPETGRTGFLAGETLEIRVRLAARFGSIVKFEGEVLSGTEPLARGSILVRRGIAENV